MVAPLQSGFSRVTGRRSGSWAKGVGSAVKTEGGVEAGPEAGYPELGEERGRILEEGTRT